MNDATMGLYGGVVQAGTALADEVPRPSNDIDTTPDSRGAASISDKVSFRPAVVMVDGFGNSVNRAFLKDTADKERQWPFG